MTIRTILGSTLAILTLAALLSLTGQAQAASHEMGHGTMMDGNTHQQNMMHDGSNDTNMMKNGTMMDNATHMDTNDMDMDDMKMDSDDDAGHMMQDGTMMDGTTHQQNMMHDGSNAKDMMKND
ncbi:hypothetical protein [Desulfovibrio ferrophilus]|uniref:Pentapeptide MXKDX repeat protein n=1 Tax=Desulfovibrio ferrophilus TaxID=241368 RepID=A0A2Z6B3G0_9BACT|nr:hypothetical protein [Desulfovibrio ferrophilus]BBD09950.1 uncharacterized protein DFE_3224 [Desulfovibrio ferrophilus]